MRLAIIAACSLSLSGVAFAEPIGGAEAKRAVFPPAKAEVAIVPVDFLTENDVKILKMVVAEQPYYGAVAVSPDEGLASEATVAAANHHDVTAASDAARAACEAKRKGKRPCEIVAHIRPAGWEPRPISLSADATKGLRDDYGTRGARALAVSALTGRWGLGKGEGAAGVALSACAASGAQDCAIAVAD